MRKKHKVYQSPTIRIQPMTKGLADPETSSNLQEQKNRFLKQGKTPVFVVAGDTSVVEELAAKTSGKIRFDLLGEAEYILRTVKREFRTGEAYLDQTYGPRISQDEANEILLEYISENNLQESLTVYWSNEMNCSARMIWKGYSFKCNKPEARRYSLWLNGTDENPYLRKFGLRCLMDHEIGTHFYRSYNDGFQPWFYDRKKFGLRGVGSFESLCTEEGLASINTLLRAKEKYLWLSALVYYTSCKSTEMNFKQLFDHLGQFLHNPEQRWKHVMRVKRGLIDSNDLGGYGKDQCYFEGAVAILRNIDNINFKLLMTGKICYDEVARVKRMARLGSVCLPAIMQDMESYRKQLKSIAILNGLFFEHPSHGPSQSYLLRLKERQSGIRKHKKVRRRKKLRASISKLGSGSEKSKATVPIKACERPARYSCIDPGEFVLCDRQHSSDLKDSSSGTIVSDSDATENLSTDVSDTKVSDSGAHVKNESAYVLKENGPCLKSAEDTVLLKLVNNAMDSTACLEGRNNSSSPSLKKHACIPHLKSIENTPCVNTVSQVSLPSSDEFSTHVFPSVSGVYVRGQYPLYSVDIRTKSRIPIKGTKRPKSSTSEVDKLKLAPLNLKRMERPSSSPRSRRSSFSCNNKMKCDVSASSIAFEIAGSVSSSLVSRLRPSEDIKSWLLSLPPSFSTPSPSSLTVADAPPISLEQIGDLGMTRCVHSRATFEPTMDPTS